MQNHFSEETNSVASLIFIDVIPTRLAVCNAGNGKGEYQE